MASPSRRTEREEERRVNLRTLAIASAASATAAVVTSRLWIAGTWIAAALTPVLVALISEMLHRPTEKIAQRLTTERDALIREQAPVELAPDQVPPAAPVRDPAPMPESGVRVYRSAATPGRRGKIAIGAVLGTGGLALLIAVVALTVPELLAGGAIVKGEGKTTLFSGKTKSSAEEPKEPASTNESTEEEPQPTEQETAPEDTTTEPTTTTPPGEPTTTTPPAEPPPGETAPTPPPVQP
jgi:hypothetical protein